jgi:hypothetical protein
MKVSIKNVCFDMLGKFFALLGINKQSRFLYSGILISLKYFTLRF